MNFPSTIGETEWKEAAKQRELNFERTGRQRQNCGEQALYNHLAKMYDGQIGATPFHLLAMGNDTTNMSFGTHFNPELTKDSNYFKALKDMMGCAEQNANVPESQYETVCAKEFKALRMAAFKEQLLYHQVTKKFFLDEITFKTGQAVLS